jgi:prepilin-type N-terminal cleavage/methylation domain-containing protein
MTHTRRHSGFTLIEIIVVVAIIGILVSILLPAINSARNRGRVAAAKQAMAAIAMSLDKYRDDFGRFPPNDKPMGTYGIPAGEQGGSELLYYYLCTKFKWGESTFGPYLDNVGEARLRETGGTSCKELISPLGGMYKYTLIAEELPDGTTIKRRCLVVDAGLDKLWGGDVSETKGWISDQVDTNSDSIIDDEDNISSSTVVNKE